MAKLKIHYIFYVSLLKNHISRKKRVNEPPEIELALDKEDSKEYKVESIRNSKLSMKEVVAQLLGKYYLVC